MNLRKIGEDQLLRISEEIKEELNRRSHMSAKQRAKGRRKSYRRSNGASAPPVITVGIGKTK